MVPKPHVCDTLSSFGRAQSGVPMATSVNSTSTTPGSRESRSLELLGSIFQLQVQIRSLKVGERTSRAYDPGGITVVQSLIVDDDGVTGYNAGHEGPIPDIHNRSTPNSKYRGENGISVGFAGHYDEMRRRFGHHLVPGIAGENVLIASNRHISPATLQHGLVVITRDGPIEIGSMIPAAPCVEFSRFCAEYTAEMRSDPGIKETLQFLGNGMRGFYGRWRSGPSTSSRISVGDLVYRRLSPLATVHDREVGPDAHPGMQSTHIQSGQAR